MRRLFKPLHCRLAGHAWGEPLIWDNPDWTATLAEHHCARCRKIDRRISAATLDDLLAARRPDMAGGV